MASQTLMCQTSEAQPRIVRPYIIMNGTYNGMSPVRHQAINGIDNEL